MFGIPHYGKMFYEILQQEKTFLSKTSFLYLTGFIFRGQPLYRIAIKLSSHCGNIARTLRSDAHIMSQPLLLSTSKPSQYLYYTE